MRALFVPNPVISTSFAMAVAKTTQRMLRDPHLTRWSQSFEVASEYEVIVLCFFADPFVLPQPAEIHGGTRD